jgi:hypothetical protein
MFNISNIRNSKIILSHNKTVVVVSVRSSVLAMRMTRRDLFMPAREIRRVVCVAFAPRALPSDG